MLTKSLKLSVLASPVTPRILTPLAMFSGTILGSIAAVTGFTVTDLYNCCSAVNICSTILGVIYNDLVFTGFTVTDVIYSFPSTLALTSWELVEGSRVTVLVPTGFTVTDVMYSFSGAFTTCSFVDGSTLMLVVFTVFTVTDVMYSLSSVLALNSWTLVDGSALTVLVFIGATVTVPSPW